MSTLVSEMSEKAVDKLTLSMLTTVLPMHPMGYGGPCVCNFCHTLNEIKNDLRND